MIAREESYPPETSAPSTPLPLPYSNTPPPSNKKRKHATLIGATPTSAASPAPSDSGVPPTQAADGSLLPTTDSNLVDYWSRLTVSRPPLFVPISEGSIYNTTEQIPHRLNFRYIPIGLSEPGSKSQFRVIESNPPGYVRVSWEDRSAFMKVTTDGLGLCGEKGYRSARLNVPIREGKWYFEIKIEHGGGAKLPDSSAKEGAHVRLGWGRREAGLNCPIGADGYSYGYIDKDGRKVTLSRPRPYGRNYGTGDVIGMYISLPPKRKPKANDPYDPAQLNRVGIPIPFKGRAYYEIPEYPQSKEMISLMDSSASKAKDTASVPSSTKKSATVKNLPERGRGNKPPPEPSPLQHLPVLHGSHIAYFVNGKSQGVAFQELFDYLQLRTVPSARNNRSRRRPREGYAEHKDNPFDDGWLGYYPFISLFNGARVSINAGPDFEYPPPPDIEGVLANDPDSADTKVRTWRPLCERYAEFVAEQHEIDDMAEAEAQKKAQKQQQQQEASQQRAAAKPPKKERAVSDHPKSSRPPTQKPPRAQTQPKVPPVIKEPTPSPALVAAPATPPVLPSTSLEAMVIVPPEAKVEAQSHLPQQQPEASTSTAPPTQTPGPTSTAGTDPAQTQPPPPEPELTEQERKEKEKLEARRQRKRELERARRAKKREEKLQAKKLEEEARQRAAIIAAAEAIVAAGGLNISNVNVNAIGNASGNVNVGVDAEAEAASSSVPVPMPMESDTPVTDQPKFTSEYPATECNMEQDPQY